MMRTQIPRFRLPETVTDEDINALEAALKEVVR